MHIGLFLFDTYGGSIAQFGNKHAMEMLLTGDMVSASRAADMGLVNNVVPSTQLRAASTALAGKIAAKPSLTVATGKRGLLPAKRNGFGGGV